MKDSAVEINYLVDKDSRKIEKRTVDIGIALTNTFDLVGLSLMARMDEPISVLANILFNLNLDIHPICKLAKQNCEVIRAFILDYITKRKEGKVKSTVKNVDLLSLFRETPEVFTDDFIIDELMDFFFAGTVTT